MKWGRRFALFNPKIPFFLGKRSREEQPQDETPKPSASKRFRPPPNEEKNRSYASSGSAFSGSRRPTQTQSNRAKTAVRKSWGAILGEVLWRRYSNVDFGRNGQETERQQEPEKVVTNMVKWLDGSASRGSEMDLDVEEEKEEIRHVENEEMRDVANEDMVGEAVGEGVRAELENGGFPFVDSKVDKEVAPLVETPARRLVQHDYKQLMDLFEQDCRSSHGCAEEHRQPRPALRHYSARKLSPKDIRKTVKNAVATAMSQPAIRRMVLEASMAELESIDSLKRENARKRSQPGPEKEKYRPGRKSKEAKTSHPSQPEIQTGQAGDVSKARLGSMSPRRARFNRFANRTPPTTQALREEKSRSESLPRESPFSWEPTKPLQPPEPQSARPVNPVGSRSTWKPDDEISTLNPRYIDLKTNYSMSTKSAREKFDEAARLREQAKQAAHYKSFPSMEELNSAQNGKSMFQRCSKFQKPSGLKSPVLEWKLFKSSKVDSLTSGITTESEEPSESEQVPPESGSDCGVESSFTEGKPFGVKVNRKDHKKLEAIMVRRDSMVLTEVDNVQYTRKILASIGHGEWLNDEIMNGYMKLLQDRDTRYRETGNDSPKCHFHKTFFMNRLLLDSKKYDYSNVQRWTKPMRLKNWGQQSPTILDCDVIFFPVHLGMHWALVMALVNEKRIVYYDSLQGRRLDILRAVGYYLKDEARDKKGEDWTISEWSLEFAHNIPRQTNSCDCGMFVLMYAKSRAEISDWDDDWGFTETDMGDLRVGMLKEFLAKKLL